MQAKPYLYKNECCLSDWLYLFARKVVLLGNKKTYGNEDLFPVKESLTQENMEPEFMEQYQRHRKKHGFRYSLLRPFAREFFVAVS